MADFKLSQAAEDDFAQIMRTSLRDFGHPASIRYKNLMSEAIRQVAQNPARLGSRAFEQGVRLYHLRHAAKDASVDGEVVRKPRHFIVYRMSEAGVLEIVRILYDAMDFEHHLKN
jgi:toxin ParE1/3/4